MGLLAQDRCMREIVSALVFACAIGRGSGETPLIAGWSIGSVDTLVEGWQVVKLDSRGSNREINMVAERKVRVMTREDS